MNRPYNRPYNRPSDRPYDHSIACDPFESKKIMVLGDIMLDHYIWGSVERISPEAPVPVLEVKKEEYRLGGAANVALNIKTLGAEVVLIGVCGDDENGRQLKETLISSGIGTDGLVEVKGRLSTLKTRISSHNQQIVRVDYEQTDAVDTEVTKALEAKIRQQIDCCDALIIEDYDKGVMTPKLIKVCRELAERGVIVAVDPKKRNFMEYRGVTIFKPNFKEFEEGLNRKFKDSFSFVEAAQAFRKEQDFRYLVVTKGAEGMFLFDESKHFHFETKAREVFDVSGAGDTVISVLTLAYACGLDMAQATAWARNAASVVCGKLGTSTLTEAELMESLDD